MFKLVLMIDPEQVSRLEDAQARHKVFSRSELVRRAIEEWLTRDEQRSEQEASANTDQN